MLYVWLFFGTLGMVVLSAVAGVIFHMRRDPEKESISWILLISTALAFCGIVLFCDPSEKERSVTETTEIFSVVKDTRIHGDFVLGCGSIDSQPVYLFYKAAGEGVIMDRVDALTTEVVETNKVTPNLTRTFKARGYGEGHSEYDVVEKLYVPKGTIRKEFKL